MPGRQVKFDEVVAVRVPAAEAARLRALAAADDRPPSVLARRFILDGLQRATEGRNGPTAA